MKKHSKKNLDIQEYTPYLGGDMDVEEIERLFHEKDKMDKKGIDSTSSSLRLLQENATPQNIPVDVFMQLDESGAEDEDLLYFDDNEYFLEDDFNVSIDSESDTMKQRTIVTSFIKQIKIGSYYELWPESRLLAALSYDPFDYPIFEFQNYQTVLSEKDFRDQIEKTQYINLNHMTLKSVVPLIPKNTDAVVLDPPCMPIVDQNIEDDNSEWGFQDLVTLFRSIRKKTEMCFIIIWVDPDKMNVIVSAAGFAHLVFADSCVVELFEGNLSQVNIPAEFNTQRHSRMLFIYKTREATREMFVKQKNRDCTWGIVSNGGKSRGRLGMPDTPHSIVEGFLPLDKNHRVFVELWPTRFQPHPHWILIDEIDPLNKENDIKDDEIEDIELSESSSSELLFPELNNSSEFFSEETNYSSSESSSSETSDYSSESSQNNSSYSETDTNDAEMI